MTKPLPALLAAAALLAATPAFAADHEIRMLNRGEAGAMVFEPAALHIHPGDTVTFVSVDPGHNVETVAGAVPEGVEPFRSPLSQDVTVNFDIPGLWVLKCTPHLAMGMVAVIVVGDEPHDLAGTLKGARMPPVATKRLTEAYTALGL